MNNLEGIPYDEVINNNGISYNEFKKGLLPDFKAAWVNIITGLLIIILSFFIGDYFISKNLQLSFFLIPFFSLIIGFWIAFLNLFVHEAGHFFIHPNKKANDVLANIILCSWVGLDIKVYRKLHWQHHLNLGNSSDLETSYFHPLTPAFLIETLTGIHLFRLMINENRKKDLGKNLSARASMMLIVGLTTNLLILFLCFYFQHWWMAITWTLAMIVFFPFLATIRQVIEHRDELAKSESSFYNIPKTKVSRLFSDSLFSRLFGSAGFNKHMIHHWDPHLPFMTLKKVENFLLNCKRTESIVKSSRTTYFIAFKKIFTLR